VKPYLSYVSPPASGQVCGSKKIKLLNSENDTYHQVMRNLFAAKAEVRILQVRMFPGKAWEF